MPFRVELELTAKGARSFWTKTISAFNTISDNFKIDIKQGTDTGFNDHGEKCYSEILFTSMNKTKTTVLNVGFQQCFFKRFIIEGEIARFGDNDGGNSHNNFANSYTIIVSSQDMNTLFKDCADDTISWRIFMLCGDEITHMIYSNKLFVEFETKNGMKKKYSIAYRPAKVSYNNQIHCIYLQNLEHQKQIEDLKEFGNSNNTTDITANDDFDDERVHRFAIDTTILKNFINVFPLSLEDFKIEITPNDGLISFRGFNRQQVVTKTEAVYNKPMTLGIQLRLNQIIYHNVIGQQIIDGKIPEKIQVSFRLKNFKTFIQIISNNFSSFNNDDNDNDNKGSNKNKTSNVYHGKISFSDREDVCDVMFSNPGYPIIFERRYFLDGENELLECCSVTLTEVTDGESGKIILEGITNSVNNRLNNITMPTMNDNLKNRLASVDVVKNHGDNNRNSKPVVKSSEPLFVVDDANDDEAENDYDNKNDFNILGDLNINGESHSNDKFWDDPKFHQTKVVEKILETQGTGDELEVKDGDDELEDDENIYLGPTQKVQIKGIFD